MQIFRSKVDLWLGCVLLLSIALCLGISAMLVMQMEAVSVCIAVFIASLGAGLPLWILLGTHYTVDTDKLRVQSGPFSWTFPLSDIHRVQETRNPLSGPALSLDRLQIDYQPGKSILVSPKDKHAFLQAIHQTL